ncbi:hypothetical protein ACWGLF_06515 [Streptomyces puniciscabiei]
MRHRRTGARWLAVAALIDPAAACASGTGAGAPAEKSLSAPTGSSATGSTRPCLSGTVTVLHPPADNSLRTTCVHVGTTLHLTLEPSANHSWAPVRSSNANTVTVLDGRTAPDGTRSATARAASTGTATLSSADSYTPDPHGPPSRAWRLILTVVP